MVWYCKKCKKVHKEDELCPQIRLQLKCQPDFLAGAANFAEIACQERLISTQGLDYPVKIINQITGKNLSYEGTKQYMRDIQVFKRLAEEPYKRKGCFETSQIAQSYYNGIKHNTNLYGDLYKKITGYQQEVDWLRWKKGQIQSIWERSYLLNGNAAGIDGETVNRFTGKMICRTSVKSSKNPINSSSTGIRDVIQARNKNALAQNDHVYAPEGFSTAARKKGITNPIEENGNVTSINNSTKRILSKVRNGKAETKVTGQQLGEQMFKGAIVAAATSITVSSITTYIRYKNGEISREEAYHDIEEDSTKGVIYGAGISAVTIFIPGGVIGVIGGLVVGTYLDKTLQNILDEIFGKGYYAEILNASGYIYGMTVNLEKAYYDFMADEQFHQSATAITNSKMLDFQNGMAEFQKIMKGEIPE